MKVLVEFIKTTILGGVLVWIPVVLCYLMFSELLEVLIAMAKPIAEMVTIEGLDNETRWKLRRAVRIVNETLAALGLEKHPDKTFIGRAAKGFDFLGYRLSPKGLAVAKQTRQRFVERAVRLQERERSGRAPPGALGPRVSEVSVLRFFNPFSPASVMPVPKRYNSNPKGNGGLGSLFNSASVASYRMLKT